MKIGKAISLIPIGSTISLILCWIGAVLFAGKFLHGMNLVKALVSRDKAMLSMASAAIGKAETIVILICILIMAFTLLVLIYDCCFMIKLVKGDFETMPSGLCGHRATHRILPLWIMTYLANLFWIFILSALVLSTCLYFAYMQNCQFDETKLVVADGVKQYCMNFTHFSVLIHQQLGGHVSRLALCSDQVDTFCRLTKVGENWVGGAYLGCLLILTSLWISNARLSMNWVHARSVRKVGKIVEFYNADVNEPLMMDQS